MKCTTFLACTTIWVVLASGPASAQQHNDWYYENSDVRWYRYLVRLVGSTGGDTLQAVVEQEGMILSRLAGNRAAFSFRSDRIPLSQRGPEFTTGRYDFVAEFEVCDLGQGYLEGKTFKLALKIKAEFGKLDDLVSSITALQAYFDGHKSNTGERFYSLPTAEALENGWRQIREVNNPYENITSYFTLSNASQQIHLEWINETVCEQEEARLREQLSTAETLELLETELERQIEENSIAQERAALLSQQLTEVTSRLEAFESAAASLQNPEVIEILAENIATCWNIGALSNEARDTSVTVRFELDTNGRPVADSIRQILADGGSQETEAQVFETARRAILRCGAEGFNLPINKYQSLGIELLPNSWTDFRFV